MPVAQALFGSQTCTRLNFLIALGCVQDFFRLYQILAVATRASAALGQRNVFSFGAWCSFITFFKRFPSNKSTVEKNSLASYGFSSYNIVSLVSVTKGRQRLWRASKTVVAFIDFLILDTRIHSTNQTAEVSSSAVIFILLEFVSKLLSTPI